MLKKIVFTFLTFLLTLGISLTFQSSVLAADLNINFTNTSCSLDPVNGAIFHETNLLPLDQINRSLKAVNTYSEPAKLTIAVKDEVFNDSDPSFADILTVTITEVESGNLVYGPKTIRQWKNDDYIQLSAGIPGNAERNYIFTVSMDNVGNEYQGKQLIFDLNLNCQGLGEVEGEDTEKNPVEEVLQAISILPETGQIMLALFPIILLFGVGLVLKRRKKERS